MDYKLFLLLLIVAMHMVWESRAQHEDIPYENVEKICSVCSCSSTKDVNKRPNHLLRCVSKDFKHILARWPDEFGRNHNDVDIVAIFSGNKIQTLQQLPATNATLSFTCTHCSIEHLQVPTFMDVPNIKRLNLGWNSITTDELTPDVFRGPYRSTTYEPIALIELDLMHNQLHSLNKRLFEHTPRLKVLNLAGNGLRLDSPTGWALASASNLRVLDLSDNSIENIPLTVLKALINLETLNLAGNQLTTPPDNLQLVGRSLLSLKLTANPIERFSEKSFLGLKVLKHLNISVMPSLTSIEKGTFTRLETLEVLDCSRNTKLKTFYLDDLLHSQDLTLLDLSYSGISNLPLSINLTQILPTNATNYTTTSLLPRPWPKLRVFETVGNPWFCDCELLQTLEYIGVHHQAPNIDFETRCATPYPLAGARLSNLTAADICAMKIPRKYQMIEEDPPRFLRKRYIILTAITAAVVIVLGFIIGLLVVCIRRRLKNDDFGIEPIRYTSVRSSNLSAFSHVNPPASSGGHA